MNNKIYLCSFASNDLNISVKRFQSQAKSINIYYKHIEKVKTSATWKAIQGAKTMWL